MLSREWHQQTGKCSLPAAKACCQHGNLLEPEQWRRQERDTLQRNGNSISPEQWHTSQTIQACINR